MKDVFGNEKLSKKQKQIINMWFIQPGKVKA